VAEAHDRHWPLGGQSSPQVQRLTNATPAAVQSSSSNCVDRCSRVNRLLGDDYLEDLGGPGAAAAGRSGRRARGGRSLRLLGTGGATYWPVWNQRVIAVMSLTVGLNLQPPIQPC
jgi:hypothetical protein